jgi:multiple sugar transport system permease protein
VFLAALAQIPRDYFDAARVEGVGAWRGFWRITLPLLRPVVWFVGLTSLIGAFQVFTIAFVLPERGPLVLVQRAYQLAWGGGGVEGGGGNIGMASAFAILLYLALIVFT